MNLHDLNLHNPVHIGYYDPFSIYPLIKKDIDNKLPLTNLHWKYHSSKPLKSIPLLPVQLIEEVPKKGLNIASSKVPSYDQPHVYTRLMFVKYDNIDTYRSQVRPLIKEWLKHLVLNADIEWTIVYFVPLATKDKHLTIIKTSNFDKLKIDFGADGKELLALPQYQAPDLEEAERCFKLHESSDTNRLESYNELIQTLKSLLIKSFDSTYQKINERLDATSSLALAQYFNKHKLADLLKDMTLYQDSLHYYNELYSELNLIYKLDPDQFTTIPHIPKKLNNFKFDTSENFESTISTLSKQDKLNLFSSKCLIFFHQSRLLQSLAISANSISISAIFISNLYQKLIFFLNDLSSTFPDADFDEYIYCIVDNYLELPISKKLMEINNIPKAENGDVPLRLPEILEFKGELKLFQRSSFVRIAKRRGFSVNGINQIFDEILLDESEKQPQTEISYAPLLESLKEEKSFLDTFEKLTEDIIQEFVACDRSKTIDMLSIDLALLNYQKGSYQESINILQDSFDFFILNGWNFMGGVLLEIYLDCIERLSPDNHLLILNTCIKLFANLINNNVNSIQIGINSYNSLKKKNQILKLFEKVEENSLLGKQLVAYPIDALFKSKIIPYINADRDTTLDRYYINIKITNLFGIDFYFDSISLVLSSNEDQEQIEFRAKNIDIDSKTYHTIRLYSNHFKSGLLHPAKLTVCVNENLQFFKEYEMHEGDNDAMNATVIHNTSVGDIQTPENLQENLLFFQDLTKFRGEFSNSRNVQLGSTDLLLRLYNTQNAINDIKILLDSKTEGLRFTVNEEFLSIDTIDTDSQRDIKIPYTFYSDNKTIIVSATISYLCNGEKYCHMIRNEVDTSLSVSVSVQDIFRTDYIYSKFQVGTSDPKLPIRIRSNKLITTNEHYEIVKPKNPLAPLVAFGEQPATIFYKIIPDNNYTVSTSDSLDLFVDYSNLNEECIAYLRDSSLIELGKLKVARYWCLLETLIVGHVKFDLNNYAINNRIQITNYSELSLLVDKVVTQYVEHTHDRLSIIETLKTLLGDNKITINDNVDLEKHQIYISVPMPLLKSLQIVEFRYEKHSRFLVGEPIQVQLLVKTITRWCGNDNEAQFLAQSSPDKLSNGTSKQLESFQLTIQNDDNWLISGFKKHAFDASETSLDLVLIPLNVGKVLLPKVSIKSMVEAESDPSMDIEFKNGLETLLVVPDLNSITFSF
jgi:hypothetical protein